KKCRNRPPSGTFSKARENIDGEQYGSVTACISLRRRTFPPRRGHTRAHLKFGGSASRRGFGPGHDDFGGKPDVECCGTGGAARCHRLRSILFRMPKALPSSVAKSMPMRPRDGTRMAMV